MARNSEVLAFVRPRHFEIFSSDCTIIQRLKDYTIIQVYNVHLPLLVSVHGLLHSQFFNPYLWYSTTKKTDQELCLNHRNLRTVLSECKFMLYSISLPGWCHNKSKQSLRIF